MGLTDWLWSGSPATSATPPSPSPELPPPPPPPPLPPPPATEPDRICLPESTRLRKQLTILLSGSIFLLLSLQTTRRALRRRYKSVLPAYYSPNQRASTASVSGAMDALEALSLATLNVTAFGIFAVGAGMFVLDVSNINELRERFRASAEVQALEKEAEEELEEWIVGVLARKEKKEEVRRRVLEELERQKGKEHGRFTEI